MLDRSLTKRIANAIARAPGGGGVPAAMPADLAGICADAEQRVVAYTGLRPSEALPAPEAVARSEWIAANVNSMGALLDSASARVTGGREPSGTVAGTARAGLGAVLSVEAGAITGYLSQRVLGQYEFTLVDPQSRARLLFVAPNITQAGRRLNADGDELLRWIAIHEVTHAVQFSGIPWLRAHLAGVLEELIASLELKGDPRSMLRMPDIADVRELVAALKRNGIVALGGTQRRELVERLQTIMAVVEGHAEHVMDAVGAEVLPSLAQLRAALDRRRRERPPLLALLERLIGLDAKLRQYEDGRRFCDAVVRTAGVAALHSVFDAPERLPTAAELTEPAAWMRRTGVSAAAA